MYETTVYKDYKTFMTKTLLIGIKNNEFSIVKRDNPKTNINLTKDEASEIKDLMEAFINGKYDD